MISYNTDSNQDYDVYYVDSSGKPVLATSAHAVSEYPCSKRRINRWENRSGPCCVSTTTPRPPRR